MFAANSAFKRCRCQERKTGQRVFYFVKKFIDVRRYAVIMIGGGVLRMRGGRAGKLAAEAKAAQVALAGERCA